MNKILIIEDDSLLGHYFQLTLINAGFDVHFSPSAKEAYEEIESCKPDLILLDLMIPEIDGFQILEHLKAEGLLENIPVIVVSNLGDEESVTRAMSLGSMHYFIKANVLPEDIIAKIHDVLD